DTNFDRANEIYAVNTVAFAYLNDPIKVRRGDRIRIYLVNALEFDLINSFHIHGNFFDLFPIGTSLEPTEYTDTVVQGQGRRDVRPDPVRIEQVVVNDRFTNFMQTHQTVGRLGSDKLTIIHPWIAGEAYEISLVTATGGTIGAEVPVATESPQPDATFF